jgi:hypothetical protein
LVTGPLAISAARVDESASYGYCSGLALTSVEC